MNAAQRRLLLVCCLLLAGVFSWGWYLGPLRNWALWDVEFASGKLDSFYAEHLDIPPRRPDYPGRPENLAAGVALPLVFVGFGLFVWFGRRKDISRRSIQRFVSPYLTHFVGRRFMEPDSEDFVEPPEREKRQYRLLADILQSGYLADHPGAAPGILGYSVGMNEPLCSNGMFSVSAVCFCDIPLDDLGVHMSKYGKFGLCFLKRFLIERGTSPVFYVATNSLVRERDTGEGKTHRVTRGEYFNEMGSAYWPLEAFVHSGGTEPRSEDADLHQLLREHPDLQKHPAVVSLVALTHFLDAYIFGFLKCFDDRLADDSEENFYMEREWRAVTRIDFTPEDVAFVVVPRDYAGRLRTEFPFIPLEKVLLAEACGARR
jgi:hypothetical protein